MRCYSFLSVFFISVLVISTTIAKRPFGARGYSEIDEKRYMKIYVNSPFHYSEQIRFLARRFPNTPENAFDIVQLGFLNENVTLDLSHGGGNFLPKYPFWFERENYMMSTRILHWIYEKKVIVTGRLRKRINHKSVGFYQAPQEIFYAYGGYYMEMIFVKGFSLDEGFPHRYYVQGDKKLVLPTAWYPRDRFSETRLSTEYFDQNTVEAYRSYLGNPTSFHGDTDQLILESLGPPMPYHATFNFGGQRAYFAGFFSNSVTAEIMTATSTYTFYLHKNTVEFNNITKTIEKGLYGNDILDRLGSISLVNVGEALVIIYNIPHRFDFTHMHKSVFSKQIAQFSVKWDGPITKIILSDTISNKRFSSFGHDLVFQNITLLQHVDIDNELIQ